MHYVQHLSKDKKLQKLIAEHGHFSLEKRDNLFLYLCYSIMSQQLSTKVAKVIRQRFLDLFGGKEPTAQEVADMPFAKLRGIGMSNAKANYVHNVARFHLENGMGHDKIGTMSDEEVIEYLTQIKGVGRWTTEMLLMFALCREDVMALDDLGIQNAMIGLYKLDNTDKKKFREQLVRISKKWQPYRTYACMYMWRWKDNAPVTKSKPNTKNKKSAKRKTIKKKK